VVCDDLDRTRTWLVGVDDSLGVTLPRALIRCRQNAQRKRDALFAMGLRLFRDRIRRVLTALDEYDACRANEHLRLSSIFLTSLWERRRVPAAAGAIRRTRDAGVP
jgi:hypothetical protein